MKKYNVEIIYAVEGQILKDYFEEATHAVCSVSNSSRTIEIEKMIDNKDKVDYYYSFISDSGKYDITKRGVVISVHFD